MGKVGKRVTQKRPTKTRVNDRVSKRKNSREKSSSTRKTSPDVSGPSAIPFQPTDRILLVGEGDFSFSKALLVSYNCTSLLATSFDPRPAVIEKYPQAVTNLEALDAEREKGTQVLFEVDATKIGTSRTGSGGKPIKRGGFDKIVFNFPHVGGKTKDVARQVRYNQELLLGFFNAAVPLLAPMGIIVVTTFEGLPYETWDLKGLAKDAGLKSQRSFRFESQWYPGYKHARTLGNIEGGRGWKGEERSARTYLLELKDEKKLKGERGERPNEEATGSNMQAITNQRTFSSKKRKRADTDSESD